MAKLSTQKNWYGEESCLSQNRQNDLDPIVAVETRSEVVLWDGYHRVGASYVKESDTIPAVIGTMA